MGRFSEIAGRLLEPERAQTVMSARRRCFLKRPASPARPRCAIAAVRGPEARRLLLLATFAMMGLYAATGRAVEQDGVRVGHLSRMAEAPLYFEANRGQVESGFQFVARGRECDVLIAPAEAVVVLGKPEEASASLALGRFRVGGQGASRARTVRFRLEGANPQATMAGLEELSGKANYFIGNDPAEWHAGIPLFPRVAVDQIYPGVRLVYYADELARLEYDFVLQPNANPGLISFRIEGVDKVEMDAAGNLVLKVDGEQMRQHAPVIYQMVHGVRKQIQGGYRLKGEAGAGFWVGKYDHNLPLVIDPALSFSAYIGGKMKDKGWGIAADTNGNVWVAGETLSRDLHATPGALRTNYQGGHSIFGDGFVAKFGNGTNLSYLTYLGGSGQDAAFAIAVDPATGAAFVTGYTDSANFPITNAFQSRLGGTNLNARRVNTIDAFVTKLNTDGTLAYSTYLGGYKRDVGLGIAVDNLGRAYVTGYTESPNFPTNNSLQGPDYTYTSFRYLTNDGGHNHFLTGYYRTNYVGSRYQGNGDAFVTRFSADGASLEYSTFLGGTNQDIGEGIAVDANYSAYVVGMTASTNFPTLNAFANGAFYLNNLTNRSFVTDGFISKLSPSGDALVYSSYIGANNNDDALAVAVDTVMNAYVTGDTFSTNFPVTLTNLTAWPSLTNVNSDVFVMRFNPDGTTNYSVVFGGRSNDKGLGIAVDASQNAYVVGMTLSPTNFANLTTNMLPLPFGFSLTNSSIRRFGMSDAFIVELDSSGSNVFSAYLGGAGNDQANGIAWDPSTGAAYIVGTSTSTNFVSSPSLITPTNLTGSLPPNFQGGRNRSDAFVGKINFP